MNFANRMENILETFFGHNFGTVNIKPINQLSRVTVPQVQGYRRESFGILTNPVGGKRLIDESALRYITPQSYS